MNNIRAGSFYENRSQKDTSSTSISAASFYGKKKQDDARQRSPIRSSGDSLKRSASDSLDVMMTPVLPSTAPKKAKKNSSTATNDGNSNNNTDFSATYLGLPSSSPQARHVLPAPERQ